MSSRGVPDFFTHRMCVYIVRIFGQLHLVSSKIERPAYFGLFYKLQDYYEEKTTVTNWFSITIGKKVKLDKVFKISFLCSRNSLNTLQKTCNWKMSIMKLIASWMRRHATSFHCHNWQAHLVDIRSYTFPVSIVSSWCLMFEMAKKYL